MRRYWPRATMFVLAVTLAALLYPQRERLAEAILPEPPAVHRAGQTAPTRVLVVLDTVRAENTSLCGYERPTTPRLQALETSGASVSCRAVSPSTWTLPSHASLFTGLEQWAHGAGVGEGDVEFNWGSAAGLSPEHETLAEALSAEGYQTVAISANPVVSRTSGLLHGFDVAWVADTWLDMTNTRFGRRFRGVLDTQVDPSRPLFLFLNIADAHDPWHTVPEGTPGIPPRGPIGGQFEAEYESGALSDEEASSILAHMRDGYDYGVMRADRNLGVALDALTERGWLDDRSMVVVTSDHGEFLGEHQLMLHGGARLYEEVTRVPLVVWRPDGDVPSLPSPVSVLAAYDLMATGKLRPESRPVTSTTFAGQGWFRNNPEASPCGRASAALWSEDIKVGCWWGELTRFDLDADPAELHPTVPTDQEREALMPLILKTERAAADLQSDEALSDALRALGYLDEE